MTNWRDFIERIPTMSEKELCRAIYEEANGKARASHLTRLHMRFSKVRAARERRELLRGG